jgi:hypothetical protein
MARRAISIDIRGLGRLPGCRAPVDASARLSYPYALSAINAE